MKNYRKKPVVIQAKQYTQEMQDKFIALGKCETPVAVTLDEIDGANFKWDAQTKKLSIDTLEGDQHIVSVNDFIIRGVQGEHYACKPDIFEKTYEAVE